MLIIWWLIIRCWWSEGVKDRDVKFGFSKPHMPPFFIVILVVKQWKGKLVVHLIQFIEYSLYTVSVFVILNNIFQSTVFTCVAIDECCLQHCEVIRNQYDILYVMWRHLSASCMCCPYLSTSALLSRNKHLILLTVQCACCARVMYQWPLWLEQFHIFF